MATEAEIQEFETQLHELNAAMSNESGISKADLCKLLEAVEEGAKLVMTSLGPLQLVAVTVLLKVGKKLCETPDNETQ